MKDAFETAVGKRLALGTPKSVFLAAVSGGADSTAMLAALSAIREKSGGCSSKKPFALRCLHVEHGIRPASESRGDALAVKALSEKLKVPCKIVHIPEGLVARAASELKLGIEGAARLYRRRIWNREMRRIGAARVLVAHTKDDLLENILLRFLRGAGPAGLASLAAENGNILRPLIDLSRRDVLSYLEEKGLSFRVDSTNNDTRYLRNRIRHKLIPFLDCNFPFWKSAAEHLGETQRLAAGFIETEARKRLRWEKAPGGLRIPLDSFLKESPILREESFFLAADVLVSDEVKSGRKTPSSIKAGSLKADSLKTPRRTSLRRFLFSLDGAGNKAGGVSAADLGPIRAEKRPPYLFLKSSEKSAKSKSCGGFSLLIKESGSYILKNRFIVKTEAAFFPGAEDEEALFFYAALPLVIRAENGVLAAGQKRRFSDMIKSLKGYSGQITAAEDSRGVAALLGESGGKPVLLYRREDKSAGFKFRIMGV